MRGLLIANKDPQARNRIAELFCADRYRVSTTDSVANALELIINKEIQVVVLDGQVDQQNVARLIPLLKKCNRHLAIIMISDEMPLELMRRIRQEGIFYHALRATMAEDSQEIRTAVQSAFNKYEELTTIGSFASKEKIMFNAKSLLTTFVVTLLLASPAFAVDTAVTYSSGLLVLLFAGFCALIIVAQLVPAALVLFGMTKAVTQRSGKTAATKN